MTIYQVASAGEPQWERIELKAATEILAALPPRIRQVAMLRAIGTGYKQIAELTGNTERTVQRLVRRANEAIGEAVREATRYERSGSPRANRLQSLEREPPRWLVAAIGRRPDEPPQAAGQGEADKPTPPVQG